MIAPSCKLPLLFRDNSIMRLSCLYILPVAMQFLLYASPVGYAISTVPEKWRTVYLLNPISSLLEAFRFSILNRGSLHPQMIAYAALVSVGLFVFGAFAFRRMERKFADVI